MSEWKQIDEIAKVRRGASPRPIGDPKYFGGEVGWVRISDVTRSSRFLRETEQYVSPLGESLSVRVNPGELIMSICGTLGRPIIVDMPACIHDGFVQFSSLRDADTVYLYYALQHAESAFNGMGQPGTQTNLNTGLVGRHQIFAPKIEKQRRIAEILSTTDEAIEQTEALIAKCQQIKAGLMHDLFTRGVTSDGQLRPTRAQAPQLYRNDPRFGWIPKGWEVARLKDKAQAGKSHIKTGPFGTSLKGEHWVQHGHPVITIGALGEGELLPEGLLFVSPATALRLHDYQLTVGDVVFSRVADVGRSAVIEEEHAGWIMSSNLMRISLNPCLVEPHYLQSQFASDLRLKAQIRTNVNSGGRDVANGQILNRLLFVWPPHDEQILALSRMQALDLYRRTLISRAAKLRAQKQGLMQDLLTGRVPVKVGIAA